MSDSKSAWISAVFGAVIVVLAGATLWKVTRPDPIAKRLAAMDAKIEATNATLAKTQTASTAVVTNDKLAQLDAKMGKIDAALAELQKGALLKGIGEKLDALNAGVKSTDAALASLRKSGAAAGLSDKLTAIGVSLAELQKSVPAATGKLAEIKQAIPSEALVNQFSTIASQMKSINTALADIQKASVQSAKPDGLQGAASDLKKNIDSASSLQAKLADEVGKLHDVVTAAAKPKPSEVVVVYLDMPDNAPMPKTVATVSPLQIQFNNIGSADDEGQAAMIVGKLQDIVKGRKDCTISVAGYADTLGGDKTNLRLSKKRARAIAEKLKTAFAGKPVQINESAWGERRLADWTPDGTARKANRRVDVAVSCKG
jgi:outer membrane protein OmpA-like peptidoglycan-associated protein